MRHLSKFKTFESIIIPKDIDLSSVKNLKDLKNLGKIHDFDVFNYDEFYNSLSDIDKKTAPPKHNPNSPIFALFHPINKKPTIVINNPVNFLPPNEIISDILGHELIHKGQASKSKIEYTLPNPNDLKLYFSDKNEIMAFSFSIAKELLKRYPNTKVNQLMDKLSKSNQNSLYSAIKSNVDNDILKRYNKYIYNYLCEFSKKEVKK